MEYTVCITNSVYFDAYLFSVNIWATVLVLDSFWRRRSAICESSIEIVKYWVISLVFCTQTCLSFSILSKFGPFWSKISLVISKKVLVGGCLMILWTFLRLKDIAIFILIKFIDQFLWYRSPSYFIFQKFWAK